MAMLCKNRPVPNLASVARNCCGWNLELSFFLHVFPSIHFFRTSRASLTHGMAHKRNDRIALRFSTVSKVRQDQHPRPHRFQICRLWTRRSLLGAPGAAANPRPKSVARKHALPSDIREGQSCNISKRNCLAINQTVGNFLPPLRTSTVLIEILLT